MISPTGHNEHLHRAGFTLIELIVVMGLLMTLMAVSMPSLSRFFAGRALEEEARRFLALTRYARSEAIGSGMMMEIWIEPETGSYGLEPQTEYITKDYMTVQFALADGLEFAIAKEDLDEANVAKITFFPDGSTDETSVPEVNIIEVKDINSGRCICQTELGMGYSIEQYNAKA